MNKNFTKILLALTCVGMMAKGGLIGAKFKQEVAAVKIADTKEKEIFNTIATSIANEDDFEIGPIEALAKSIAQRYRNNPNQAFNKQALSDEIYKVIKKASPDYQKVFSSYTSKEKLKKVAELAAYRLGYSRILPIS